MDKNTLLGFLLIGLIIIGFSYFEESNSSKNQKNTQQKKTNLVKDSVNTAVSIDHNDNDITHNITKISSPISSPFIEKDIVIENEKLHLTFSNIGGRIKQVKLKEYQSFDKSRMVLLFDSSSYFGFRVHNIKTKNEIFQLKSVDKNQITYTLYKDSIHILEYVYTIKDYNVTLDVHFINEQNIKTNRDGNILFEWNALLVSNEKHIQTERLTSSIFYKYSDEDYRDYLSENGNDDEVLEKKTEWIVYKSPYFSAVVMPTVPFHSENSTIKIKEIDSEYYLKEYSAILNTGVATSHYGLNFSFLPNESNLLKSYNVGLEDILNLGWGIIRYINQYFIKYLFDFLYSFNMNVGLIIILLTLLVKIILFPIYFKNYKSSAKMRVLRPEIEEINKKYIKKDQAIKKQQETMELYRKTGVNPFSGCIPSLLQVPLLFAMFRFFPSEIYLRQESFLWAEDLASYDSVYDFGFSIPFYGDHISLFTLLMAISTLIYTHFSSSNMPPAQEGMPNMKFMFYLFPVMTLFFFNNYCSGLTFYYFLANLASITQMVLIKKFFIDEQKIRDVIELNKKKPQKKSMFQKKLEELSKYK